MKNYFSDENIIFLEDQDFNNNMEFKYNLNKKPMLVMVMGSFCGFCKQVAPVFSQFAKEVPDVVTAVIMIDGDTSEKKLSQRLSKVDSKIEGVPTFMLFDSNGKYSKTHKGGRTIKDLKLFSK